MSDSNLPEWASEDITPEGSASPVYLISPEYASTVSFDGPAPQDLIADQIANRAAGIKVLVKLGLTQDQASAVAGG